MKIGFIDYDEEINHGIKNRNEVVLENSNRGDN